MMPDNAKVSLRLTQTDWTRGPNWLRCRSLGKLPRSNQQMAPSTELVQRLGQEACLDGHRNCVNCLEWNQNGDLLASGSDDNNVIIWDVFRRKKRNTIETGHERTIFSVKFMPNSSDTLLATGAGDGQVKVTSIYQKEKLLNCNLCHTDRVKRLAVHPHEPNLIWSAGEDGLVLEYDTRLRHICNGSRPNNTLVNLRDISDCLQAKCIAVNPLRSEMLAVGSNDVYNRLYDRRYIKLNRHKSSSCRDAGNNNNNNNNNNNSSCIAYFAPGHLLKSNNKSNHIQTYGTTYLSFNSRGTELLASYHAEQVYSFDVLNPVKRYQSFEATLKPLLLGAERPKRQMPRFKNNLERQVKKMRMYDAPHTSDVSQHHHQLSTNDDTFSNILASIHQLNEEISSTTSQSDATNLRTRADMLVKRGWRGDAYQALRDCYEALAINPMDPVSIYQLAKTLVKLGDIDSARELSEFLKLHRCDYSDAELLSATLDVLEESSDQATNGGRISPEYNHHDSSDLVYLLDSMRPASLYFDQDIGQTFSDRHHERSKGEAQRCSDAVDYRERYCGHCNMNTDIKEASFFGPNDEFIVGGSDDGAFYIWNKETANIVKAVHADHSILNCVQPHPNICMLATSGMESTVKFWSPIGPIRRDIKSLDARCAQNQKFISTDPLEAMIMMLYPDTSQTIN